MDVVILGAGGQGRVVLDILRAGGSYNPIGFLDADSSLTGQVIHGLPVMGPVNLLPKLKQKKVRGAIVAIGDNRARRRCADVIRQQGMELITAVHPSAVVSTTAQIGANTTICAGAIVCTDARVGESVIVNTGVIVDHECEVGDGAHLAPGVVLAGRVKIGQGAFVGIGAKILPCMSVGAHSIVGAGAVVIADVPANVTVVGVPAKVIKIHPPRADDGPS